MKKILVLISQGSELLEISPFTDIFGWNNIVGEKKIVLETCAVHSEIQTTWNLLIKPEIDLNKTSIDIDSYSGLVIPGGFGYRGYFEDINNPIFLNLIQEFARREKIIIGVCTGSILLAKAGVLKNHKATTYLFDNKRYFNQLQNYEAIPVEKEFVIDRNIITVSGPKNAIEAGFYLLKILTSEENEKTVRYNMNF